MQYRQHSDEHQGLSRLYHRGLHDAGVEIDSMAGVMIQVMVQSGFMMLAVRHGCDVMAPGAELSGGVVIDMLRPGA